MKKPKEDGKFHKEPMPASGLISFQNVPQGAHHARLQASVPSRMFHEEPMPVPRLHTL